MPLIVDVLVQYILLLYSGGESVSHGSTFTNCITFIIADSVCTIPRERAKEIKYRDALLLSRGCSV